MKEARGDSTAGQVPQCACGAEHLTAREIEVVQLAAAGLTGKQIATRLNISSRTVEDHLSVIRRRADARRHGDLIARIYAAGILVGWPPRWSGKRCLNTWQCLAELERRHPGHGVL
jgi:DNA-binding NarL/FixJ family response regulator